MTATLAVHSWASYSQAPHSFHHNQRQLAKIFSVYFERRPRRHSCLTHCIKETLIFTVTIFLHRNTYSLCFDFYIYNLFFTFTAIFDRRQMQASDNDSLCISDKQTYCELHPSFNHGQYHWNEGAMILHLHILELWVCATSRWDGSGQQHVLDKNPLAHVNGVDPPERVLTDTMGTGGEYTLRWITHTKPWNQFS